MLDDEVDWFEVRFMEIMPDFNKPLKPPVEVVRSESPKFHRKLMLPIDIVWSEVALMEMMSDFTLPDKIDWSEATAYVGLFVDMIFTVVFA